MGGSSLFRGGAKGGCAWQAMGLAYQGNPVDLMPAVARARIPLRHVISLNDRVVPPQDNTLKARQRLLALGGAMELVTVQEGTSESGGHHFTLPEVFASSRFIQKH